jgi:ADP-heptose:LPS heptosyltransferase
MVEINGIKVNIDCLFFKGDVPCKPNKQHGYHCEGCPVYTKINKKILIIKLGAIGDVIRTTPLLRKIRQEYPDSRVTWLTHTPSILPESAVEEIMKWDAASILYLQNCEFDIVINLDKDKEACALMNSVRSEIKFGYRLVEGVPFPSNELAASKYLTGIFDDISVSNTKSYVEEIFEIAGWKFNNEEYVFDNHSDKGYTWNLDRTVKLIGLNTGCGDRWITRLWSEGKWVELIKLLQREGLHPVLLGGEQEHEKNTRLSRETGALYPGFFPLQKFINLMDQMDVVVSQITMAMHIAIALKKKSIILNNIFNPNEFYLYNRGSLVSPDKKCDCFYRGTCIHGTSCMEALPPGKVLKAIKEVLA